MKEAIGGLEYKAPKLKEGIILEEDPTLRFASA